jgi:hypothetical protein
MNEYRVTKYSPDLRDSSGRYLGDDWTSVTQIGQSFGGVVLTEQEYKRVEHAFISVALAFLSEGGLAPLRVEGLENARRKPLTFREGTVLSTEQLRDVIGRILREGVWCRLQSYEGFLHFGRDYYMYVGVPHRCISAERKASELGLYVEEFVSPYHEETQ